MERSDDSMPASSSVPVSGILTLNIGGQRFATTRRTLTKDTRSMLAALFSGKYESTQDEAGAFFIDRDGTWFRYVLNFLRDGDVDLPSDRHALAQLAREARFYQVQGLITMVDDALQRFHGCDRCGGGCGGGSGSHPCRHRHHASRRRRGQALREAHQQPRASPTHPIPPTEPAAHDVSASSPSSSPYDPSSRPSLGSEPSHHGGPGDDGAPDLDADPDTGHRERETDYAVVYLGGYGNPSQVYTKETQGGFSTSCVALNKLGAKGYRIEGVISGPNGHYYAIARRDSPWEDEDEYGYGDGSFA